MQQLVNASGTLAEYIASIEALDDTKLKSSFPLFVGNRCNIVTVRKSILPFLGAGVAIFDGNGDYLTVGSTGDFDFGAGLWTCEGYIFTNAIGAGQCIIQLPYADTSYGYAPISLSILTSGKLGSTFSANGTSWLNGANYNWGTTLAALQQYYVAIVRTAAGYIKGYLNGVEDFSYNIGTGVSLKAAANPLRIGFWTPAIPSYLNGQISAVRISNIARYSGPFTPPRVPFTADENTVLLLHFLADGTTFTDSSPTPKTITPHGDVYQSTDPW